MSLPPTLRVDFNRLDDDDVLWTPRDAIDPVFARQFVILRDGDENRCLGVVMRFDARRVYIQALLSTWQDAEPVDVTVRRGALDEVLQQKARYAVTERQLTVGVNVDE